MGERGLGNDVELSNDVEPVPYKSPVHLSSGRQGSQLAGCLEADVK